MTARWALLALALALASDVRAQTPQPVAPAPQPADPDSVSDSDPDLDPGSDLEPEPEADEPELPAAHRPRLDLRLEPAEGLMTGDVLTVELRVDALAGDDIAIPRDQEFGIFEMLDRAQPRREEHGDRTTHVFRLELLALEPGPTELPPIRVRVVTTDQVVGEVETEARDVTVGSVLGNEPDAEPKPPTEPVEVWQEDDTLWWVLGGLGLLLVGAILALLFARWWRRRQKAAAPPPPPRPAEEIAIEKLDELRVRRGAMLEQGEGEAWVDGVSDAVREYFGHRYEFEGLESTSDEVIAALRKRSVRGISIDEVAALLRDCDLVKFARADVAEEQSEQMLAAAYRLVRATTPRAGAVPMGPSGPPAPGAPDAPAAPAPAATGDDRWMPRAPAAPAPPASESASASESESASASASESESESESESADSRWMPQPAPAPPPASPIPQTMETPSPVRSIPATQQTPSPVRSAVPDTLETPSPIRGADTQPVSTPVAAPREIPSTLPGTGPLIPETTPPPPRDTLDDASDDEERP